MHFYFAKKFEKLIGLLEEVTEILKVMGKLDRHIQQTKEPMKDGIYSLLQLKFAEKKSGDKQTTKKTASNLKIEKSRKK